MEKQLLEKLSDNELRLLACYLLSVLDDNKQRDAITHLIELIDHQDKK